MIAPPEDAICITIKLPRAPRQCSSNRRGSSRNGARERAGYRKQCASEIALGIRAWRAENQDAPRLTTPIWTRITYGTASHATPAARQIDRTLRPRDAHNVHGPGKIMIDGLADVFGIDDCQANVRDLGAEISKELDHVLLTLWFSPLLPDQTTATSGTRTKPRSHKKTPKEVTPHEKGTDIL